MTAFLKTNKVKSTVNNLKSEVGFLYHFQAIYHTGGKVDRVTPVKHPITRK